MQGWLPSHAQQLNWIFKHADVIFSSGLNSSELSCNTMMVSCAFSRTFRIERQMFPGRRQAHRSPTWFLRSWTGCWHVAPAESRKWRAVWVSFESGLVYSFPVAAVTDPHKVDDPKQQKLILSQVWRPEVCSQGVSQLVSSRGSERIPTMPLSKLLVFATNPGHSLASRYIVPISSWVFISLLWVSSLLFSPKDNCLWILAPS